MEKNENKEVVFAPPSGNAELPKNVGQVTKNSLIKEPKKQGGRTIKVVAIAKGWFDEKRIEPGHKFSVSEKEFSSNWMQKI